MKKVITIAMMVWVSLQGFAITKTWVGTSTGWNMDGNWSPSGIPGAGDDVVFSNNKNCIINTTVVVNSFTMSASYTGTVTRNSGTPARSLTTNNFFVSGGTFNFSGTAGFVTINTLARINSNTVNVNLGTSTIIINSLSISGGSLTLPASDITFNSDVIVSGGNLNLTNTISNIIFNGSLLKSGSGIVNSTSSGAIFGNQNTTISGGFSFNTIKFTADGIITKNYDVIGNLTTNLLELDPSDGNIIINRDPIFISGDYDVSTSMSSTGTVVSNNIFIFNGTAPQLVNLQSDVAGGYFFSIGGMVTNNTGSGVSLTSPVTSANLLGGITVLGGSFDDGAQDITLTANQNFVVGANATFSIAGLSLPAVSGSGAISLNATSNLVSYGVNALSINSPINFRNFTINKPTSGSVSLASSTTVNGILNIINLASGEKLNTGGNLTLASSATQTASLLDFSTVSGGGSVNGNVKVQRFYQGVGRPKLFGTPIESGATVATIGEGIFRALLYTETGQESGVERGISTASGFIRSFRNANRLNSGNLSVGRGYSLRQDANGLAIFDGIINNGTINVAVTNTTSVGFGITPSGFNLLSNPYPSALDWSLVNTNSTGVPNSAVSIFNGSTYTATNVVASGQGFFVKATNNGNITFTNAARINNATSNNTFLRTEEKQKLLYVYVKNINGGFNDALAISLNEDATSNFDSKFDLTKIFQAAAPSSPLLFSMANGTRFSLDVRPKLTTDIIIPISLIVNENNDYVFSTSNLDEWYKDYSVFIKDSINGNVTLLNLKTTRGYIFSKATTDTDRDTRFSLVIKYTPNANLGLTPGANNNGNGGFTGGTFTNTASEAIPDAELKMEETTFVKSLFEINTSETSLMYSYENKIAINFANGVSNSTIQVFDLMGNIIYSETISQSNGKYIIPMNINNPTIYLVKLSNKKENITKKVFLY